MLSGHCQVGLSQWRITPHFLPFYETHTSFPFMRLTGLPYWNQACLCPLCKSFQELGVISKEPGALRVPLSLTYWLSSASMLEAVRKAQVLAHLYLCLNPVYVGNVLVCFAKEIPLGICQFYCFPHQLQKEKPDALFFQKPRLNIYNCQSMNKIFHCFSDSSEWAEGLVSSFCSNLL
jgi:hypothetical protein